MAVRSIAHPTVKQALSKLGELVDGTYRIVSQLEALEGV